MRMWGLAGPWYRELLAMDKDKLRARMKLGDRYGLRAATLGLDELIGLSDDDRSWLFDFAASNDMHLSAHFRAEYADLAQDQLRRDADFVAETIATYSAAMRPRFLHTIATSGHRFDRNTTIDEKLSRLASALGPVCAAAKTLGLPVGVENHGDFYVSDLVALCREVPNLYIFLDTGNTFLVGEKPLPAYREAAPFVIGSHFKDARVRPCPDARPLHFEVAGSILGEGDAHLAECMEILRTDAPHADDLTMEIEMVAPVDVNPLTALERSLGFLRSIGEIPASAAP